jgi:hypothetical protein
VSQTDDLLANNQNYAATVSAERSVVGSGQEGDLS